MNLTAENEMLLKLQGSEPKDPVSNSQSAKNQLLTVGGTEKKTSDSAKAKILNPKQYKYPSKKQY